MEGPLDEKEVDIYILQVNVDLKIEKETKAKVSF